MIYRKWSLLTGPAVLLGGIVGAVIVSELLFIENDWLRKTDEKNQQSAALTKLTK